MMQATKEFHWKSPNGNQVYAVEWPVENPRAVVGLIHGMGEHIRRYDGMVDWYRQHGIAFVGYDRQGFGRSEGKRAYATDYKVFVDEVARLVVECEVRYTDTPVFLYGHSFGGQTLLRYLIKRKPHISGAIVSGPHIQLSFQPNPLLVAIGKLTRKIVPTFTQDNQLEVSLLSRRAEVVTAYQNDPLVTSKLTSQTGIDVLEIAAELDSWRGELPVPTLVMHGGEDGITSPAASQAFAERNPSGVSWKLWPGLYHEIHMEPEREEVYAYTLAWMEERIGTVHRPPESV